jgi:hypothetical protein
MDKITSTRNKNKKHKFLKSFKYNKNEISKSSNLTINSFINKKIDYSKDSTDKVSRDFLRTIKINPKLIKTKLDYNYLRNIVRPEYKTHNNKKIYIKNWGIKDIPIYSNYLINHKTKKNEKSSKTTKKSNNIINRINKNKTVRLSCLSSKKKTSDNKINCRTTDLLKKIEKSKKANKDINYKSEDKTTFSEVLDISLGDSPLEINVPKISEEFYFNSNHPPDRKSAIPFPRKNISLGKIRNIQENNNNLGNEENKKTITHHITDFNCYKKKEKFDKKINNYLDKKSKDKKDGVTIKNITYNYPFSQNDNEHEHDNILKNYNSYNNKNLIDSNNNDELFRFSNISSYNNNDLRYINDKNKNKNKYEINIPLYNRNSCHSVIINPKIEKIEEDENHILNDFLIDDDFEKEIMINDKNELKNINNDLAFIPCMNCEKMVKVEEIDKHSNNCFKIYEEIKSEDSNNNFISLIENKLKRMYDFLNNIEKGKINIDNELNEYLDFIFMMKRYIEQILAIKIINSLAIEELSEINNIFNKLMEKYASSKNIFTLISRIKILLEEKKKYFIEKNRTKNDIKVKSKKKIAHALPDNKIFRHTMNLPSCDQFCLLGEENSVDQAMSENETTEFFEKMEKILDDKKEYNLDNFVNEAKNKRLFLMEVLKVKFQKINNNQTENIIPPLMIWKEAMKNNIKMNNWSKFIFDELNNPNKYLKLKAIKK